MSEPSQPNGTPGPEPRPRAAYGNPSMRISDAERAEVSDRLSQHYGDGRLDEAEFSKRLDQAMHAVTQSDLNGLFDDLPGDAAAPGGPAGSGPATPGRASRRAAGPEWSRPASRSRRPLSRLLKLAVLIVIAVIVGHALANLLVPSLLIAMVVVLWLRRGPSRRHRHSPPEA
jgi:Domain of unknown function (DUF1707)